MPKETFKTADEKVVVGWSKRGWVELSVGIGEDLIILSSYGGQKHAEYARDLVANFDDEKEFNKFLKALARAGKQAFSE